LIKLFGGGPGIYKLAWLSLQQ